MRDTVRKIVSKIMNVPVDEIDENSSPDTIDNWDSLKHMNLVLSLEQAFDVRFGDEEIIELLSIGAIIRALQEKGV